MTDELIDGLREMGMPDCDLAAGEIESLRSRLQAAEAENNRLLDDLGEANNQEGWQRIARSANKAAIDAMNRADAAEASLTRVAQLCDEWEETIRTENKIMTNAQLNAWIGRARELRAALAGGTSPEPTEPPWVLKEVEYGIKLESGMIGFIGRISLNATHQRDLLVGPWRPVDVASEPPNPPELCIRCGQQITLGDEAIANQGDQWAHTRCIVNPFAVGEPLKPTEQEQR